MSGLKTLFGGSDTGIDKATKARLAAEKASSEAEKQAAIKAAAEEASARQRRLRGITSLLGGGSRLGFPMTTSLLT
jgi:hypothetical protein